MAHDKGRLVHTDFKMLERGGAGKEETLRDIGLILRTVWALPMDTFITPGLPLLITKLSLPFRS
jgi:hypothetical protein